MRRLLEKLAAERSAREKALAQKLEKFKGEEEKAIQESIHHIDLLLARLKESFSLSSKKGLFTRRASPSPESYLSLTIELFEAFRSSFERHLQLLSEFRQDIAELINLVSSLADARDREWDALGSNHVTIIFKSLEWRIEQLMAESEDARILLQRFYLWRDKLEELLLALGERPKVPQPPVQEAISKLRDWRYASFENRFRGRPEEVRKQLEAYASFFPAGGKVLDLGCGRGEFVELLREKGIDATGVDLNEEMIAHCRDRGLPCEQRDLVEKLLSCEDGSLAGIFSSQVIEHLPPSVLEIMIDLCYLKLSPSGILILETINPASVFALLQVYFLDPSHEKPIHPRSLKFLLETAGFRQVEIRYSSPLEAERLKELPGADEKTMILNQNIDALNELLFAPVNYAAIAWKEKS